MCSALSLDRWAVHAEVVQASVHRLDLCFKIVDDLSEPSSGLAGSASIRAFALTQHADRDRHPADARLEAVTLELSAQRVDRRGGHMCANERSEKVIGTGAMLKEGSHRRSRAYMPTDQRLDR
jgi:hypothetical protein